MYYSCPALELWPFTTLGSACLNKEKVEIHIYTTGTHIRQNYHSGHYDRTTANMTMGGRGDPDVKNGIQGVFQRPDMP